MKPVFLLGQIMFYLRIFNFQAQLGTRDIQKFDFKKVLFNSKKLKFMILDRLPKQPTIPYRVQICVFVRVVNFVVINFEYSLAVK